jgi:TfoX/Sxy family transcriptional regulator of competence genes
LVEKKMFGGVGYILRGNMACGVVENDLIVRVGQAKSQEALAREHMQVFNMTGKPMSG